MARATSTKKCVMLSGALYRVQQGYTVVKTGSARHESPAYGLVPEAIFNLRGLRGFGLSRHVGSLSLGLEKNKPWLSSELIAR